MSARKSRSESKGSKGFKRLVRPIIWSCAAGLAGIILFLLVMSVVMSVVSVPQMVVEPAVIFAASLGAFIAGNISARLVYGRGFIWAMVCGLILYSMIMSAGAAILPEGFGPIALVKLFAMLLAAGIGGMAGTNSRYSHRR